MNSPRASSFEPIKSHETTGWIIDRELPDDLVPAQLFKANGEPAWRQIAHTRASILSLPLLQGNGGTLIGLDFQPRFRMHRSERGNANENFPDSLLLEAFMNAELPVSLDGSKPLGQFTANPAHDFCPTTILPKTNHSHEGKLVYVGREELAALAASPSVDERVFAGILLARSCMNIQIAERGDGIEALQQRLGEFPLGDVEFDILTKQSNLGIAHVLARRTGAEDASENVLRIENGVHAQPGMAFPIREYHSEPHVGLLPVWRPLLNNGKGGWSTEIPGGFSGWENELFEEAGAKSRDAVEMDVKEEPPFKVAEMATIADWSREGYGIDLRVAKGVEFSGEQQLDPTEVGLVGKPKWIPQKTVLAMIRDGRICDGRTLAAILMHEIYPPSFDKP